MVYDQKNGLKIFISLLLPFVTCWVQWQFWSVFKPFVWFLFFPTVFFSSRLGGKVVGILSTVLSALLVVFFFIPAQLSFVGKTPNSLFSVALFLLMGVIFSMTHDRLERAKQRAVEAQDAARIANEQLQEVRIGLLQAEKMQTDATLLSKEEQHRTILQTTMDGFWQLDMQGRVQEVNEALCRMSGYTAQELLAKHVTDLEVAESADEVAAHFQMIVDQGEDRFESRFRRKDGSIFDVEVSAQYRPIENGRIVAFLRDITERKQFEDKLQHANDEWQITFDSIPDMVTIVDNRHRIVQANRTTRHMLGCAGDALIGKPCYRIFHGLDTAPESCPHAKMLRDGKTCSEVIFEARLNCYHHVTVTPLYSPDGALTGSVHVARDITEIKRVEIELQRKNAEMEQFLYTFSHDLRTPLVTVKSFLGFLEKDMAGSDHTRVSEDLQYIHGAADKMKLMLDELLEMSRIDRVEESPVSLSLFALVAEALAIHSTVIEDRKADIHLAGMDLMLFGDRTRLNRIWQNLIENALKYSRGDGIPRIEIGWRQENGDTVFFVKDNGIGIDSQYSARVFKIFEKLNPKSPGAGLGLCMVQRIVEKCGGRIWVESDGDNAGSCFSFTLPLVLVPDGHSSYQSLDSGELPAIA